MCDNVVNTHSSTVKFVAECYKTQNLCGKAFNKCFLVLFYILDQYKTQEMYEKVISDFSKRYVPDQYKTQRMCAKECRVVCVCVCACVCLV